MRVGILGAGAMGSMFGGYLSLAGHDVTLVDPWTEHIEMIAREGLIIERPGLEAMTARPSATSAPETLAPCDLVIVLTKGFAIREAVASAVHAIGPATWVVPLGNGLANDRAVAEVLGADRVVPGTTTAGSEAVAPGRIRVSRRAASGVAVTHLGRPRAVATLPDGVVAVAQALTAAGLPAQAVDDADVVIWTKLAIAGTMGPVCAALGRTIADVWEDDAGRALIRDMYLELVTVADAERVALDVDRVWRQCVEVWDGTNPEDYTSMAIDILKGRRTEIDSFSLEIVRLAQLHGLQAPISQTVGRMVKTLEKPTRRSAPIRTGAA